MQSCRPHRTLYYDDLETINYCQHIRDTYKAKSTNKAIVFFNYQNIKGTKLPYLLLLIVACNTDLSAQPGHPSIFHPLIDLMCICYIQHATPTELYVIAHALDSLMYDYPVRLLTQIRILTNFFGAINTIKNTITTNPTAHKIIHQITAIHRNGLDARIV